MDDRPANAAGNWLERFRAVQPHASCRDHDPTFGTVFVRGQGARLWDTDGNEWLDLTCGYSASNFGHACQPLIAAAQTQLSMLTHLTGEPHVGRIELAERLIELFRASEPPGVASLGAGLKVVFNATGSRAVESAWKACFAFRPGKLLVLSPGFHGRSIATSALSATRRVELSDALDDRVVAWPSSQYAYCARCPLGMQYPHCETRCADDVVAYIARHSQEISAVLVEPALGARGYVFPPPEYFQRLRAVTAEHQVLMIADEIQTGMGRCGNWLLSHSQGWAADLTVLGKSLGGGLTSISAVVGRADVLESIPAGAESETFAATPLACAVSLRCIDLLYDSDLFQRGAEIGQRLRDAVRAEFETSSLGTPPVVVEGQAASCVVEFAASQPGQMDLPRCQVRALEFAKRCHCQRLRIQLSGPNSTRVVMLPPLNMDETELTQAVAKLKIAAAHG